MTPIKTIDLDGGGRIELHYDPSPPNPREENENLGTFQVYSTCYPSPDEIVRDPPEIMADEIGLMVWAYAHGGVIYRTGEANPFTCSWDSGFAGIIFCSKEKAREYLQVKRITPAVVEQVKRILNDEVEIWNKYYNGELYGYQIFDAEGNCTDSCWGYYSEEEALSDAGSVREDV